MKIREYQFEGNYFDGRKSRDGYVYLLSSLPLRAVVTPWYDIGNGRTHIPYSSIFWYPDNYEDPLFVNIISFDLSSADNLKTKMVSIIT